MPGLIASGTKSTPRDPPTFTTFTATPMHPTFGALLTGIDFSNITPTCLSEILLAMAHYGVVIFRSTKLTNDTHIAFARRLGSLDDITRFLIPGVTQRYPHLELFDASNMDAEGNILDPNSARAHGARGNSLWHCDSSFNPRRASFSLLRAVEVPPPGTGGPTWFADARTAFEELEGALKEDLLREDYIGCHSMAHSRKLGSPEFFKDLDVLEAARTVPMGRHRIVQRHEPSGRMTLYVGAHLHHLEGVEEGRSRDLVTRLNEWVTREGNTFKMEWEGEGDMVIWDNRCVLHRAGEGSFQGKYRRDVRRATVHDDSPTAWGENEVGAKMGGFGIVGLQ